MSLKLCNQMSYSGFLDSVASQTHFRVDLCSFPITSQLHLLNLRIWYHKAATPHSEEAQRLEEG